MSQEERYRELADKWLRGEITPEEAREYAAWYNQDDGEAVEVPSSFAGSRAEHEVRMFGAIRGRTSGVRRLYGRVAAVAAAVLLLLGGSWYWWYGHRSASRVEYPIARVQDTAFKNDVLPGSTRATLTLGNGRKVVLDTVGMGVIANQGGMQVRSGSSGIAYLGLPSGALVYNTLTTGRGQQFAITLSDGSRVWLNAASSIRFPAAFGGDERRVEVTGEAYLEVAADERRPFHVTVAGNEVVVLGTHFDVNAYPEEGVVRTTLLEGAVKVNGGPVLRPEEEALVGSSGQVVVRSDPDARGAIAWKDGLFHFNGTDIGGVMRQAERWYNIQVLYEGNKTSDRFQGDIPRTATLTELLKILEYSRVHFRLEGNTLTVLP